jgi:hypothetical protein
MLNKKIKELLNFSSKHHIYHYQEAYEHFLIAFVYTKLHHNENALKHIEKSFFHLPHGNHLAQFLQNFINFHFSQNEQSFLTLQKTQSDEIYLQDGNLILKHRLQNKFGIYDQNFENLLPEVAVLFEAENFIQLSEILLNINNYTAQKHFDYHCQLADMYFEIAREYLTQNAMQDAKYFIQKALETDKRNPNL